MFEKLENIEKRLEKVNDQMADPDVISDIKKYTELTREMKNITPVVEKFREYRKAKNDYEGAKALLDEGGLDSDFKEMLSIELNEQAEEMERLEEELKVLLLPKDPNDDRNVIIEIRGGAGGEEAALFAGSLLRMYSMYADTKGFKWEILNGNVTGLGGYKEVSMEISGEGAYSRFKFESGVHRVQKIGRAHV